MKNMNQNPEIGGMGKGIYLLVKVYCKTIK